MGWQRLLVRVCQWARPTIAWLSFSLAFAALIAPSASSAGSLSPQAIIAALRSRPEHLPKFPDFVHYVRGSEQPVSVHDHDSGVIAYFTLAADYEDTSATSGITYRIFSNNEAADKFWGDMSAMNNAEIMGALGSDINEEVDDNVTVDWPWRGRQPFKDITCETYISKGVELLKTARCYAEHLDLPVVVSGVRIVQVSPTISAAEAKRQFTDAERQDLTEFAATMLSAGMARIEQIETDGR